MKVSVQSVASLQSGLTAQRNLFASPYFTIPFSPISFSFTLLLSLQHCMATWSMAAGFSHRPWDDFKMSGLPFCYPLWGENGYLSDPSKMWVPISSLLTLPQECHRVSSYSCFCCFCLIPFSATNSPGQDHLPTMPLLLNYFLGRESLIFPYISSKQSTSASSAEPTGCCFLPSQTRTWSHFP